MGMVFYYNAFFNLNTERHFDGKIVNSLSWYSVQRYAEHYELDFNESEIFHFLIEKMDNAYCEEIHKKIK